MRPSRKRSKGPYDVFLSYSHVDKPFVQALGKRLRRYRPPHPWWKWPWPPTLRVFRDDDEVDGTILSEELQNALAVSATLVVVCSPDARRSTYVTSEIETFRRLHPTGNIVPILLRGLRNNAARQRGAEAEAAIPDAVLDALANDPLPSDFTVPKPFSRPNRRHWYHLLASIYQLPRELIEGREKRRRRVRIGLVAAIASVLIVGAVGFVWTQRLQFSRSLNSGLDRVEGGVAPRLGILLSAFALENADDALTAQRARWLLQRDVNAYPLEFATKLGNDFVTVAWTSQTALAAGSYMSMHEYADVGKSRPRETRTPSQITRLEAHPATTYDPQRPTRLGDPRARNFVVQQRFNGEVWLLEPAAEEGRRVFEQLNVKQMRWCVADDVPQLFVVATGADATGLSLYQWNPENRSNPRIVREKLAFGPSDLFEVSPDCARVAVVSYRELVVSDLAGGKDVRVARRMHPDDGCLRWSPDGRFLAACDLNFVVIWRAAEPSDFNRTPQLRVHPSSVTDVAWAFDGSQLASVSKDGALMIGDPSATKERTIRTEEQLSSVAWNASADRVATGSLHGQLQVWSFDGERSPAVQVGQRRTRLHGEYVEDSDSKITGATRILDEARAEIADAELIAMAPHYGAGRSLEDGDCQRYFGLSACRVPWSVRVWSWAFP